MSVGVHTGGFDFFRVGASHQELIVAGPAATSTTKMEQAAEAGQIVVSSSTAARGSRPERSASRSGDGLLLRWRSVVSGGPGSVAVRSRRRRGRSQAGIPVALRELLRTVAQASRGTVLPASAS